MSASRFLRDTFGGAMVEFVIVFPILLLTTIATVDATLMIWEWNQAAKATDVGARIAAVSNPVATGITQLSYDGTFLGDVCANPATGTPTTKPDGTTKCPSVATTCIATAGSTGGTCTDGRAFNDAAYSTILSAMQIAFPRLRRENVEIVYETTGLGFVGRPGGLPMNVSVSIRCMSHTLVFLGPFLGWTLPANPCGTGRAAGILIPASTTAVPSEDLLTN
jgi:Flp pilus assembly protein TadG